MTSLFLASASPRRRELLTMAGYEFTVLPAVAEEHSDKTSPEEIVKDLSVKKAEEVYNNLSGGTSSITKFLDYNKDDYAILAADTVVAFEGKILGKPADEADAKTMLSSLQGKTHKVYTGVTLVRVQTESEPKGITFFEETDVTFYPLTEEEIDAYIATKEPMDKAGAYAIQGRFAIYVKEIKGDYYNVMGLPIARVHHEYMRLLEA